MPASLAGEGLCILGHWNCTRRPASTSPFGDNDLRISALSLAAPQQRDPGTDLQYLAAVDARLARVCAAWSSLPEHVILAVVDSAGAVEADRLQHPSRDSRELRPPPVSARTARVRRPRREAPHPTASSTSSRGDQVVGLPQHRPELPNLPREPSRSLTIATVRRIRSSIRSRVVERRCFPVIG